MRAVLRTAAWCGVLTATLVILLAGADRLPPPPAHDPAALRSWIERTDPALTSFSLLRLAAIAVVAYLLFATVLLVVAQVSRVPALMAAATRLTLPSVERLVRRAVGVGLAVTLAGTAGAPLAASAVPHPDRHVVVAPLPGDRPPGDPTEAAPGSVPVLRSLDDGPRLVHLGPAATPGLPASPTDAAPPTAPSVPRPPPGPMTTADGSPPTTPTTPTTPPTTRRPTGPDADAAPAPGAVAPASPPAAAPPAPPVEDHASSTGPSAGPTLAHHTIVSGDHLWGVAEQTLATIWGAPPEPAETAAYLQRLIEANRSVLAVENDPDLVFPGQVFALPPVAAR